MINSRQTPQSVLLPDGRVMVAGLGSPISKPEMYNPAADTWTLSTGITSNDGKSAFRMALTPNIQGNVSVILAGGILAGSTSTNHNLHFSLNTGNWANTFMITKRNSFGMTSSGGTFFLVTGGITLPSPGIESPIALSEIWDAYSGAWTAAAPMLTARAFHQQVFLNDGRVMVMGGQTDGQFPLFSTEFYNPSTNTWSSGPNMNYTRRDFTATKLNDGRVLVVGGVSRDPNDDYAPTPGDSAEIFDPATNTWTLVAQHMSVGRREHAATLMFDGKVLITGGNDAIFGGQPFSTAELFDPSTGTWTVSTMLHARMFHTSVLLQDGRVLIAGGSLGVGSTNTAEIYGDPAPPVANAGADQTASPGCTGCLTPVNVNGGGSFGIGGKPITNYAWSEGATVLASSSSPTATIALGVGVHTVTLTVTQSTGETGTDTVQITVIDTMAAKDAMIAQLTTQLAQKTADLSTANATIAARDATIAQQAAQIASLTAANAALTSQNGALTAANAQLTADNAALTSANQTLTTQNAQLTTANAQLSADNTALTSANQTLTTQNAQLTAANAQLTADNAALTSANQSLTAQNAQLIADNATLTTANQQLTQQNAALSAENSTLSSANQALTTQNAQLTSANAQLTTDNAQLTTLNAQLSAQLAVANQAVASCQADLNTFSQSLTTSINALRNEFRSTFNNPSFVIGGATPVAQVQNVFNVLVGLKKADQKPVYKGLGGQ